MAITIGEVKAVYGMDISDFLGASRKVTAELGSLRRANQDLASFMMGPFQAATVGFRAIGRSAKAAADAFRATTQPAAQFQTALKNVSTLVDTSAINMDAFAQGIMALPAELGDATTNVKALYQAISAGAEPAQAMQLVANSAIAAKAGLSDTFTAVDAGTSIMSGFGMSLTESSKVFDLLFTTVRRGKTTFNQLAASIGPLASMFDSAGVSIEEMFAAVSAGTMTGMKTSQVVAALQQTIANIIKPSSEATKMAEELGISFGAAALKAEGLKGFLEKLQIATGGNIEQMGKFFGSVEALRVVLPLTGSQAQKFVEDIEEMKNSTGAAEAAFDKMVNSAQVGIDALGVNYTKLKTVIGAAIIGSEGFGDTLAYLNNALESTRDFVKENQEVIDGLSNVFGVLVRTSLRYTIEAFGLLSQAVQQSVGVFRELEISTVTGKLERLKDSLVDLEEAVADGYGTEERIRRIKELKEEIPKLETELDSLTKNQMDAAASSLEWNEGIQKIINELEKERSVLDEANAVIKEHSADVNTAKDAYSQLDGMTEGLLAFYGEGAEKTKELSETTTTLAEAVKQTNKAYVELDGMSEGLLSFYDAGIVSEGELADAAKEAQEMRKKQYKEQEELLREATLQYGSFADGVKLAYKDILDDQYTWAEAGLELTKNVTTDMSNSFQNVFFDAFTGQLKSAEDYFKSFVQSILASFSQMLAKMAAQNMMEALIGGGTTGGVSLFGGAATTTTTAGATTLFGTSVPAGAAAAGGIGIVPVLIAGIGAVGQYQLSMMAGEEVGKRIGYDDLQVRMAGKTAPIGMFGGGWLGAHGMLGPAGAAFGPAGGLAFGILLPEIIDRLGLGGKNDFTKLLGMGGSETMGSRELGAFDTLLDELGLDKTSRANWSGVFAKGGGLKDEFSEYSAIADTMLNTMELMRQEFGFTNATATEMGSIIFHAFKSSEVPIQDATGWLSELAKGMAQTSDSSEAFFGQYRELEEWQTQMAEVTAHIKQMQAEFSELSSSDDLNKWQRGMEMLQTALGGDMAGLTKFKTLFDIGEELEEEAPSKAKTEAVETTIDNIAERTSMEFDLQVRIKPSVASITNADENALAGLVVDWIQDNTGRLQDEIGNQIMRQLKKEGLVV